MGNLKTDVTCIGWHNYEYSACNLQISYVNFFVCFPSLKPIDITFMKMLHTKVNIVPVIAKADCLTKFEMQRLKRKVSGEIFSDVNTYVNGLYFFVYVVVW